MIRDQYTEPVGRQIDIDGVNLLELLDNVQITVYKLNEDGSRNGNANLYAARQGGAAFPPGNPFVTGTNGKTGFFADPGEYEIFLHDLDPVIRIGDQSIWWSSVPGGPSGLTATQLPEYGRALAPPGSLLAFAGAAEPTGWLFCDGRLLNRVDYPALFAAIDVAYNIGGESGAQFRIPDYRGRSFVGINNMGPGGAALGNARVIANRGVAGGVATVTLATAQIPSHSHGLTDPGHLHQYQGQCFNDPGADWWPEGGLNHAANSVFQNTVSYAYAGTPGGSGMSVNNAGGGAAHENTHPWLASPVIIKV